MKKESAVYIFSVFSVLGHVYVKKKKKANQINKVNTEGVYYSVYICEQIMLKKLLLYFGHLDFYKPIQSSIKSFYASIKPFSVPRGSYLSTFQCPQDLSPVSPTHTWRVVR